ncbi:MAG TPA: hypothetical protein VM617_07395 [Thermoanaerobaculia bacterium]|nr:hypothetical protein [Thermoanaerobaculia bacterium]
MRQSPIRILVGLAALCLLAVAPAEAAIHYQALTTVEAEGQKPQRTQVEGWVDGGNAKVVFAEAGVPTFQKGQYLLTGDGGETLYLVDPKEKTYAQWDLEAMFQALGAIMQSIQPLVNLTIDNVEVTQLASQPGDAVHGLPTTYHKHRMSYDMAIKVFGMSRANRVETVQETWSTGELSDLGLGVWLRNVPTTGFGDLDELIEAEMSTVSGFPLKSVGVTTTTGQKGKQTTSTTRMEVTSLDRSASIPASTFELPAGYTRIDSPSAAGSGEDDEPANPLRGIFGGG